MNVLEYLVTLLQTGLRSLAAYLAARVLLSLLPAFFIAGALSALFPKESITRYLGRDAPKWISYPASAVGGFVLAVCSCTIMPLFASMYRKGAGLGPAITFLFVGPAVNILAVSFTGVQIGMDIALARIALSVVFGIGIGLLMAWFFRRDDAEAQQRSRNSSASSVRALAQEAKVPGRTWVLFALLLGVLIVNTLPIDLLTNSYATFTIPFAKAGAFQWWLDSIIPPRLAFGTEEVILPDDADRVCGCLSSGGSGIEGVSVYGVFLIGLLGITTIAARPGLTQVDEEFNTWTYVTLGLVSLTLVAASLRVVGLVGAMSVDITGTLIAVVVLIAAIWWMAIRYFEPYEVQEWLWEVWRFVKQIIPLLMVGVFLAGIARDLIPAVWIESVAGRNTVEANLIGVLFGVFMYFPTLIEVPIAQAFLSLGMHRGPLLAYLLADPALSVQSILIINSVIREKKTAVYVILVTVFSVLAGLIFGWFMH